MQANQQDHSTDRMQRARQGARRTAWLFAGIAVLIYVGFMLAGVLGK